MRPTVPEVKVTVHGGDTAALTRVHWIAEDGFEATNHVGNWYARYLQSPSELDHPLRAQLKTAQAARSAGGLLPDTECILPVLKTSA